MPYTIESHTADVALRISGCSLKEFLQEAVGALHNLQQPKTHRRFVTRSFKLGPGSAENLLVDLLNEVIFLQETDCAFFHRCSVELTGEEGAWVATGVLYGKSCGESTRANVVKAATYHGLKVTSTEDVWSAVVVLDT